MGISDKTVAVLNTPLFVLGITHALIITEPYWRSPPRPDSLLGTVWLATFTLGPLGFAFSLVFLAIGRWTYGKTYWSANHSARFVLVIAVATLRFVFTTTR